MKKLPIHAKHFIHIVRKPYQFQTVLHESATGGPNPYQQMFCTGGNLSQINVMYTRYFSQFQYCLPIGVQYKNHKTSCSVSLGSVRVHIGGKTEQICGHVIGQETRIKDIKELDSPVTLVKSSLISLRPELR